VGNDTGRGVDDAVDPVARAVREERCRVAGELHDALASLAYIAGQAEWLTRHTAHSVVVAHEVLIEIAAAARQAVVDVRRVLHGADAS
jgi:nitrate/nitrite-specific signal transduction histidine kinase